MTEVPLFASGMAAGERAAVHPRNACPERRPRARLSRLRAWRSRFRPCGATRGPAPEAEVAHAEVQVAPRSRIRAWGAATRGRSSDVRALGTKWPCSVWRLSRPGGAARPAPPPHSARGFPGPREDTSSRVWRVGANDSSTSDTPAEPDCARGTGTAHGTPRVPSRRASVFCLESESLRVRSRIPRCRARFHAGCGARVRGRRSSLPRRLGTRLRGTLSATPAPDARCGTPHSPRRGPRDSEPTRGRSVFAAPSPVTGGPHLHVWSAGPHVKGLPGAPHVARPLSGPWGGVPCRRVSEFHGTVMRFLVGRSPLVPHLQVPEPHPEGPVQCRSSRTHTVGWSVPGETRAARRAQSRERGGRVLRLRRGL